MLLPPSLRIECLHEKVCPGCPLIALPYPEQLDRKRERVLGALGRYPSLRSLAPRISGTSPLSEYRTRVKMAVGPNGEVGLFGTSHAVVDLPHCRVATTRQRDVLDRARAFLSEKRNRPLRGVLRAVDVREAIDRRGAARFLVTFVVDRKRAKNVRDLEPRLASLLVPPIAGIAISMHDGKSPQLLGGPPQMIAGIDEVEDVLGASSHLATFGGFAQAHRGTTRRIHEAIAAFLSADPGRKVVDLYGGSGAIGLALAARGADVRLLESFAPAADRATRHAQRLGVPLLGTPGDADLIHEVDADAVVVNPPRRGLGRGLRRALGETWGSVGKKLAYVSCDPETLARDLDELVAYGFEIRGIDCFDMMPLTREVESLALLEFASRPDADAKELVDLRASTPRTNFAVAPPDETSGLATRTLQPDARFEVVALLLGSPRRRALESLGEVLELVPTARHTLVRIRCASPPTLAGFRSAGSPVIGDSEGHVPTNRFFLERSTLDRPFYHVAAWCSGHDRRESPLPGELATVLARLADGVPGGGGEAGLAPLRTTRRSRGAPPYG